MIKFLAPLFSLLILSQTIFASASENSHEKSVQHVRNSILSALKLSPQFAGIDVTGCDPETGLKFLGDGNESCVRIYLRTQEAASATQVLYPPSQRIDGVYIVVGVLNPLLRE